MPQTVAHKPHLKWETFFHVTHFQNRIAIDEQGLLPCHSRGKVPRIWVADLMRLPWAINHVRECHKWQRGDLIAYRVCLPHAILHRRTEGVYYVVEPIPRRWLGCYLSCQ